jgi:hypothetical protein
MSKKKTIRNVKWKSQHVYVLSLAGTVMLGRYLKSKYEGNGNLLVTSIKLTYNHKKPELVQSPNIRGVSSQVFQSNTNSILFIGKNMRSK